MARLADITWREYRERLRREARDNKVPFSGTFELTPLCNFNCRMCYVHLSREKMQHYGRLRTANEWLSLAREARNLGTTWITLTGGEALTRPDFYEIYDGLLEMGMLVTLLSNASLAGEDFCHHLLSMPPANMRFTLYGTSNATYERLCGVTKGFDTVIENLWRLSDAGLDFSLAYTLTKENLSDFDEATKLAKDLGTVLYLSDDVVPAVRGAESEAEQLRVPTEEKPGVKEFLDGHKRVHIVPEFDNCCSDGTSTEHNELFAHCGMYRCGFWVDWNGSMEPCSFMSSVGAKPFEWGFGRAWEYLLERVEDMRLREQCRNCDVRGFCTACPGSREAETGCPDGVSERFCKRARFWASLASK